jgi:hypothetical protein
MLDCWPLFRPQAAILNVGVYFFIALHQRAGFQLAAGLAAGRCAHRCDSSQAGQECAASALRLRPPFLTKSKSCGLSTQVPSEMAAEIYRQASNLGLSNTSSEGMRASKGPSLGRLGVFWGRRGLVERQSASQLFWQRLGNMEDCVHGFGPGSEVGCVSRLLLAPAVLPPLWSNLQHPLWQEGRYSAP